MFKEDFPINLVKAVFRDISEGVIEELESNCKNEAEVAASVLYAVSMIPSEDSRKVIYKRFIEHKSLEKVAGELGVTRERVRQREAKTLRELRHSSREIFLKQGISKVYNGKLEELRDLSTRQRNYYENEIDDLREALGGAVTSNGESILAPPANDVPVNDSVYDIPLEELDLSIRAFNILCRAECNTVRRIIDKFQSDDIMKLRNMGPKTYDEIVIKLLSLGITEEELEVNKDFIIARKAAVDAKAEEARIKAEARRKQEEKLIAAQIEKEKESIKYLPEIRDKIIGSAIDGLKLTFSGPVLDLLQKHVERFQLNERCVAIMMMTEIVPASAQSSPIMTMISDKGLERFNKQAFDRMRGYERHVSWERYRYRSEYLDPRITPDMLRNIFIRELNLRGEIKAVLYKAGLSTARELVSMVTSGDLPNVINDLLNKDQYCKDLLSTVDIYTPERVLYEVMVALKQIGVAFPSKEE